MNIHIIVQRLNQGKMKNMSIVPELICVYGVFWKSLYEDNIHSEIQVSTGMSDVTLRCLYKYAGKTHWDTPWSRMEES